MTAQRDITPTLAPLLQLLELEQPRVVSTTDIADYAAQVGLQWPTPLIVRRIRERGWLLDLTTQGVLEFAPASRAVAFGAGDPFVELRATLKRDPAAPYAVAAESAAYQLGLSSRRPERDVIGAHTGARLQRALEAFRLEAQADYVGEYGFVSGAASAVDECQRTPTVDHVNAAVMPVGYLRTAHPVDPLAYLELVPVRSQEGYLLVLQAQLLMRV